MANANEAAGRTSRQHPGVSAVLSAMLFAALTWLVRTRLGSPFRPHFTDPNTGDQLLEAAWWVIGGYLAVRLMRLLVVRKNRPYEARIVSDLLAFAIYIATGFAVISFAFALPIGGLLATSGIIAIVLGLALQSTLSDVFSGIAVGIERPYRPGDMVWVEGGIEGTVVQVNWRSIQISTGHNNIAVIPNSIMAKSRLENRSHPTPVRGDSLTVKLDAHADPTRCTNALTAAARACRLPMEEPAPVVVCIGLYGDGNQYEVFYWVASSKDLAAARTELFTQIHRHLRHNGIALAIVGVQTPDPVAPPGIDELLTQSELFNVLAPDERALLAAQFVSVSFDLGDMLFQVGDMAEVMFLLASGTVELVREPEDHVRQFIRLGPGDSFGMVGLIMEMPYTASATALTPLTAYRLDKAAIGTALKLRPELSAGLETMARRAQTVLQKDLCSHEEMPMRQPDMFFARVRQFLHQLRG